MNTVVVRHHPLFRSLPKLMGIVTALSSLAINILTFRIFKSAEGMVAYDGQPLLWFQMIVLMGAAAGLLWRGAHMRSEYWYTGLPIPAEQLWRGHLFAMLAGFMGLLAMQLVVSGGFIQLLNHLVGHPVMPWGKLAMVFVRPALVLVFLAGMVASFEPSLVDLTKAPGWAPRRWLLLASTALILLVLSFLPSVVGFIPAAFGVGFAWRSRRHLSPGLVMGEAGEDAAAESDLKQWNDDSNSKVKYRGDSPLVNLAVINQLFKIPYQYTFLMGLFIGFFGILLAGANPFSEGAMRDSFRLNNVFITLYLLFALTGEFAQRLHKVDALPVSRVKLLRYLVLPGLLAMLLSYGGGRLWMEWKNVPDEKIQFQDAYGKFGAAVSPGFSEMKRKGFTVDVQAPWGESHTAEARHSVPITFSIMAAHTPYLTDGATSREFLAWQLSRATEDIYGVFIEPDELDRRYIQESDDGGFYIPRKGFTVARDYGLKPSSGGPVGAFILGPLLAGWFFLTGIYFSLLRSTRTITWSRNVWWVFMGLLFSLHFLQVLGKVPFWNSFGGAVLVFSTARNLDQWGWQGDGLAYGLAFLLVGLAWSFCIRMFRAVESPRV